MPGYRKKDDYLCFPDKFFATYKQARTVMRDFIMFGKSFLKEMESNGFQTPYCSLAGSIFAQAEALLEETVSMIIRRLQESSRE